MCKTFFEFWFEETSSCHTQFASDGSSVPLEVAKKTEQIVDLFRKMPNRHFLIIVIKRNLALDFLPQAAKASGISVSSLASVRKRCQLMCSHLLERILQVVDDLMIKISLLFYVLGNMSEMIIKILLFVRSRKLTRILMRYMLFHMCLLYKHFVWWTQHCVHQQLILLNLLLLFSLT